MVDTGLLVAIAIPFRSYIMPLAALMARSLSCKSSALSAYSADFTIIRYPSLTVRPVAAIRTNIIIISTLRRLKVLFLAISFLIYLIALFYYIIHEDMINLLSNTLNRFTLRFPLLNQIAHPDRIRLMFQPPLLYRYRLRQNSFLILARFLYYCLH